MRLDTGLQFVQFDYRRNDVAFYRLKMYEQRLLKDVWPSMPGSVASQLSEGKVRNIAIPDDDVEQALTAIRRRSGGLRCNASLRRLDRLAQVLSRPVLGAEA